jgi:hypothetical protein
MKHRFDFKTASLCALVLAGSVFPQTCLAKKSSLLGLNDYLLSTLNQDKKEIFSKSLYCEPLKNKNYKQITDILDKIPYASPLFDLYLDLSRAYESFPVSGSFQEKDGNINRLAINFYFRF